MSYTEIYEAIAGNTDNMAKLMATHTQAELAAMGIDSTGYAELDGVNPTFLDMLNALPEEERDLPLSDVLHDEYSARMREEAERVIDWSDYYASQAEAAERQVGDYNVRSVVSGTALAINELPGADDLVAHPAGIPLQATHFLPPNDTSRTSVSW